MLDIRNYVLEEKKTRNVICLFNQKSNIKSTRTQIDKERRKRNEEIFLK